MRKLSYAQAIREGFAQLLERDSRVFVFGQGLWSPWYVGSSMKDLDKDFGRERIIDSPVSENATTGAGIGAALAGMKPIIVHPRMDFMLLGIDQIINQASNWSYMFGGRANVPLTIRPIINRGGEQGAQHSQALQALMAHIPGLKVVMPATAYDAKGLLTAAVEDPNPVIYIDDRALYEQEGDVPEDFYVSPIGKAAVMKEGTDISVIAISCMVPHALKVAAEWEVKGVSVEVVDVRTVKPLDKETILNSARKTGRLIVADSAWATCGISAEIAALAAENILSDLKYPVQRVTLPEAPAPTSSSLEEVYFIGEKEISSAIEKASKSLSTKERSKIST